MFQERRNSLEKLILFPITYFPYFGVIMTNLNILILDDEPGIRNELKDFFDLYDYNVFTAEIPSKAFLILEKNNIDVLILDIQLPEMNGIEVLKKVKNEHPEIEVIMITGHGDQDCIIESLRFGAFDFFKKPFRTLEIKSAIERTQKFLELSKKLKGVKQKFSLISKELQEQMGSAIIGKSMEMKSVIELISKVARYDDTSVLITGESGTGKELVARSIHLLSNRKNTYFYPVNCSAVPEHLFESEFFGHKKGAFTGATEDKAGWFEIADKGTLFLDEIGDMPLTQQIKFLRVLEDKKVRRIGSHKEIEVDVRIISATNQDIEKSVNENKFRNDLLHRLNSFVIDIPPLRKRKGDIPLLIEHYAKFFSEKMRIPITQIENDVYDSFSDYEFRGNVRELKNLIERAVILSEKGIISRKHLPKLKIGNKHIISEPTENEENLDLALAEKKLILKALSKTKNNKSKAAELLNISWYALNRKMKKYEIEM